MSNHCFCPSVATKSILGHSCNPIFYFATDQYWQLSTSLSALFLSATGPLVFELGVEITYPVSEGTSGSIFALMV